MTWRDLPLERGALDQTRIHVIRVDLRDRPTSSSDEWEELSADELARARRYVVEPPRRRFLRCRRALRRCLGSLTQSPPRDLRFGAERNGKPTLIHPDNSSLRFNVSHSGDWGVIAVGWERELGIDIETIDPALDILGLADRFFSQAEQQELHELPIALQRPGFYRLWTSKEAYMKAVWLGMLIPLGSFTMRAHPDERPTLLQGDTSEGPWHAEGFHVADDVPGVLIWNGDSAEVCYWNYGNIG